MTAVRVSVARDPAPQPSNGLLAAVLLGVEWEARRPAAPPPSNLPPRGSSSEAKVSPFSSGSESISFASELRGGPRPTSNGVRS